MRSCSNKKGKYAGSLNSVKICQAGGLVKEIGKATGI